MDRGWIWDILIISFFKDNKGFSGVTTVRLEVSGQCRKWRE